MTKSLRLTFLAFSLVLSSAAVSAQEKIDGVEFISGSPTGGWFPVASMVSEVVNQNYEGQPTSVVPGAGGVGNPLRVGTGQSDIGISYGPFLKLATQGGNDLYSEAFPKLRAVAGMTANALHVVTSGDTTFESMAADKPAMAVATGPTGSTEIFALEQVLLSYGITYDDIKDWGGSVQLLNTSGRSDGWSNRQFDLVNFFINPPAAQVVQLMSARSDSRVMSITPDVAQKLIDEWGMLSITIPAGTYPNQDADVITVGMPYVYFATTDLDEDYVYNLTKAIAENRDRLIATHASFNGWHPENMAKGLGIDLHAGAERYYRERGWLN
jgi:TRAP transporter TAXI family solute receptor